MAHISKVLCVGTPPDLRHSRQLVLENAGYETVSLDAAEAIKALPGSSFDVLVISMTVPEEQRKLLHRAVPKETRIIQLTYFTPPQELLEQVSSKSKPA
jgi:CheY-like chemotaxis protein